MADTDPQLPTEHEAERGVLVDQLALENRVPVVVPVRVFSPRMGHPLMQRTAKCDRLQENSSISATFMTAMGLTNPGMEEDNRTANLNWALERDAVRQNTEFVVVDDQEDDIVLGYEDCMLVTSIILLWDVQPALHPVYFEGEKQSGAAREHENRNQIEIQKEVAAHNAAAQEQLRKDREEKDKRENNPPTSGTGQGQSGSN